MARARQIVVVIAAMLPCLVPRTQAQSSGERFHPVVNLRRDVSVQSARVRLSDFLPAGADHQLKLLASEIDLGRAPQPGSIRVLTASELKAVIAGKLAIQMPDVLVVRNEGFPLRVETVRRALERYGISQAGLSDSSLLLPSDLVTGTADPDVEVLRIQAGTGASTATAYMKCRRRTDCASFVVRMESLHPLHWNKLGPPSLAASTKCLPLRIALVHPGRAASLVVNDTGVRITLPVFPLKRGAMGETVRAIDKVSHRIFLAEVRGENRLEIQLEVKR
jgi:hypothetical protein